MPFYPRLVIFIYIIMYIYGPVASYVKVFMLIFNE